MMDNKLKTIIPLFAICLGFIFLSPWGIVLPSSSIALIHVLSYLALGICFEIPELALNSLCLYWARREEGALEQHKEALTRILEARYALTHYIGPFTGILAVISGIDLAWRHGFSFEQGWLFWILMASIIGLYKGMYQHNRYVRHLIEVLEHKEWGKLRRSILSPFDQTLIFLEFPTYLFIYVVASLKPISFHSLSNGWIANWEYTSSVWFTGLVLLMMGSVILLPLKWAVRHFSVIEK